MSLPPGVLDVRINRCVSSKDLKVTLFSIIIFFVCYRHEAKSTSNVFSFH